MWIQDQTAYVHCTVDYMYLLITGNLIVCLQTLGPISNSLSQSTWSKQTTGKSKYKYHGHSIGKSQYLIIKSKYSSPYTGTSDTGIQILFR